MIAPLIATVSWHSYLALELLNASFDLYRSVTHYSCDLEYESTRTPTGPRQGTRDAMKLRFERRGPTYRVVPLSKSDIGVFRANLNQSVVDPFLVYNHHLTYLLGLRQISLTERLVSTGASGPMYSLLVQNGSQSAVTVSYNEAGQLPFQTTYVIETRTKRVTAINVCGYVHSVSGLPSDTVLFTESLSLDAQVFKP